MVWSGRSEKFPRVRRIRKSSDKLRSRCAKVAKVPPAISLLFEFGVCEQVEKYPTIIRITSSSYFSKLAQVSSKIVPLWEIPSTEDTSPTLPICCHRSHLSRSCCRPGKVLLPSSGPSPASQLIGQVMLETCSVNFSVYRSEPTGPTLRVRAEKSDLK